MIILLTLPMFIINFLHWWALYVPKRIIKTSKTLVILLNNSLGLTLTLRFLFVPIFGDYTYVGRILGFIYRIIKTVINIVVFIGFSSLLLSLPLVWYALPFAGIYINNLLVTITSLLFIVSLFGITHYRKPELRVSAVQNPLDIAKACNFSPNYITLYSTSRPLFTKTLLKDTSVNHLLKLLELHNAEFITYITNFIETNSLPLNKVLQKSYDYAKTNNSRFIEIDHIFLSLISFISPLEPFLSKYNLTYSMLEECVFWHVKEKDLLASIFFWQEDFIPSTIGGVNRANTSRVTPFLDSVSDDFTAKAQKGLYDPLIGKKKALEETLETLSRDNNRNVLIIGDPGSGKTTLIKGIAQEIIKGTKYDVLKFRRLVSLDVGALTAGCTSPGEISERIGKALKEIQGAGNIIVFIDEIHTLIGSTGGDNPQLSMVFTALQPHLSSGELQFIGATSTPEYRRYIEPNGSFARIFQQVLLEEATVEETMEILKYEAKKYKRLYDVDISYPALKKLIETSSRLIKDRVFPDKAVNLLERCVITVSHTTKYVDVNAVLNCISDVTKIPIASISSDESQKLLNLEQELQQRVIGQNEALVQIGNAVRRARAGIRDIKKPISSFLFVGTTGVGKTETAKALAQTYFGDENVMIRIDMSEYQKDDSVDKLIGTSDGRTQGVLTEKVRNSPFSLVLLDEIEKASPKVLLLFLQVLDDGRLSDNTGRVIDFTNTIIIATSNAGTTSIQKIVDQGGSYADITQASMVEVKNRFAPEFLNRFDGIITFRPLYKDALLKITSLVLQRVAKEVLDKGIHISFKPELIERLSVEGFDQQWGARPLRRLVENIVESYIAKKLISKDYNSGDVLELGLEVFEDPVNSLPIVATTNVNLESSAN